MFKLAHHAFRSVPAVKSIIPIYWGCNIILENVYPLFHGIIIYSFMMIMARSNSASYNKFALYYTFIRQGALCAKDNTKSLLKVMVNCSKSRKFKLFITTNDLPNCWMKSNRNILTSFRGWATDKYSSPICWIITYGKMSWFLHKIPQNYLELTELYWLSDLMHFLMLPFYYQV